MDREAWHAAIHGVPKSRTRLSDRTELKLNKYSDPVISPQGTMSLTKMTACVHRMTCVRMFMPTLFMWANTGDTLNVHQ